MTEITLLTESELRQCVTLEKNIIDIIDAAFSDLVSKQVVMPPVLSMELPSVNGEVDVKTAFIPGVDTFAIKVSPGFFNNPTQGLPSLNGLMVALSAETGIVKAVLLDNGYLTDIRTAAAGGVAARHLAPKKIKTAGVIGTGMQAELQIKALLLEREVPQILVWGRDPAKAEQFAKTLSIQTGKPVTVAETRQALVRASEVVITTTPSSSPLIEAAWLHPGLHITAMGSDSPEKNELDPNIMLQADRFIVDRIAQSIERGEMRTAIEQGLMNPNSVPDELGLLSAGKIIGRSSDQQITVCDLTGTGIQDTAIANFALSVAINRGLGTIIIS